MIWKLRVPNLVLSLMALSTCVTAEVKTPERTVHENVITSKHDPKGHVRLPTSARYVGADRWVLFGMADCELHAFVEPDDRHSVQRLYWVQFEGYLPTKPHLHHRYDSPRHATIGDMDFYVDTWIRAADEKTTAGSDSEHINALIARQGHKMPAAMMCVRLVHLLDKEKRKELMIIYAEDLAPTGLGAADLRKGGRAYDQWPHIEKGLVERAKNKIKITR